MSLNHQINKLRKLPALHLDRQTVMLGKHRLLAEINRRQEARGSIRLSVTEAARLFYLRLGRRMMPQQRIVVALLLIVLLSVSTSVIAQAAVPGDILWPVKVTLEKAELAFAVDSARESRIYLRHVDNRLRELSVISQRPRSQSADKRISEVIRRLEKDITAANQSLKITKEEKQDRAPQVVASLAKELSSKASEAIKVLEENKKLLNDDQQASLETLTSAVTTVHSQPLLPTSVSNVDSATSAPSGLSSAPVQLDLKATILEVQLVNDYISYAALEAMIEMVERGGANNRGEVTAVVHDRISQQSAKLATIKEAVQLVGDDYILHRNQSRALAKKAEGSLEEASTMVKLDNLSGSLKRLNAAKDAIGAAAGLLQEVASAGGLKAKQDVLQAPKPIPKNVTIQSMPAEADQLENNEGP